ncbi:hypothetical protein [Pelagibacterium montanilacus]|uniref:hypothetical protein n=1 Tax=Pelagibacterium montanilacus TaxID=2185280 RepID=UPI000F8D7C45|nr:hypothetical protein [Pelagibacterium montanilacus]
MIAKHSLAGALVLAVAVSFASGWWQRDSLQRAYITTAPADEVSETADVVGPAPAPQPEVEQEVAEVHVPAPEPEPVEREATAPSRVVDAAGFPVADGPIVTVNGRPLGSDNTEPAAPPAVADATPVQRPQAPAPAESATEVAAIPPLPLPRPADAPSRPVQTASVAEPRQVETRTDYEAITAAAHGQSSGSSVEFMSREQRERLAPLTAEPGYASNSSPDFDPRAEGLVEVVTANGDTIWVYEDQVDRGSAQLVGPVNDGGSAPLGFIYDTFDYRW